MATLRVDLDIEPVLRDLNRLGIELAERAISRSLNRTITSVRTAAQRSTRQELNLKAKDINRALSVRRARRGELEAAIDVEVQASPLIQFGARQIASGVSVKVKRRGARKRISHAFIARMASGHRGVFMRRRGAGRLPIDERFSTSVAQYLDDDQVLGPIRDVAQERFGVELERSVAFLLR